MAQTLPTIRTPLKRREADFTTPWLSNCSSSTTMMRSTYLIATHTPTLIVATTCKASVLWNIKRGSEGRCSAGPLLVTTVTWSSLPISHLSQRTLLREKLLYWPRECIQESRTLHTSCTASLTTSSAMMRVRDTCGTTLSLKSYPCSTQMEWSLETIGAQSQGRTWTVSG